MLKLIPLTIIILFAFIACNKNTDKQTANLTKGEKAGSFCSPECKAKNKSTDLVCGISSEELQERQKTVINSLRKQIIETKELDNGYAFKFAGTDEVVDELTEFIKTERECCGFFIFGLSISGDKSEAWLELTGPEGAKDFIADELEFI